MYAGGAEGYTDYPSMKNNWHIKAVQLMKLSHFQVLGEFHNVWLIENR